LKLVTEAITGQPDACYDVMHYAFETVVADLEMLAQAQINDTNDAVTELDAGDYAEHLYRITRRAKASFRLASLLRAAYAAERAKEKRDG
jgi:hypothetical protein